MDPELISVDDIAIPDKGTEVETLRHRLDRIEDKAEMAVALAILALCLFWILSDKAKT